jgi:hypothetical protein
MEINYGRSKESSMDTKTNRWKLASLQNIRAGSKFLTTEHTNHKKKEAPFQWRNLVGSTLTEWTNLTLPLIG